MKQDIRDHMRSIVSEVAGNYGYSEADIYVRDRSSPISTARWAVWVQLRKAGFSYPKIAGLAGWDHSSVVHGVRMAEAGRWPK